MSSAILDLAIGITPPRADWPVPMEIRIAWRMGNYEGCGMWFLDTPERRLQLEREVENHNRVYGPGTHRLEGRLA